MYVTTRYLVLFFDNGKWNVFSPFETLNSPPDLALERAKECAQQTTKNYGCETLVVRLSDIADAVKNGTLQNLA